MRAAQPRNPELNSSVIQLGDHAELLGRCHAPQAFYLDGVKRLFHAYFARSFIARSSPLSVVGYMRAFISSFTMPIDWR